MIIQLDSTEILYDDLLNDTLVTTILTDYLLQPRNITPQLAAHCTDALRQWQTVGYDCVPIVAEEFINSRMVTLPFPDVPVQPTVSCVSRIDFLMPVPVQITVTEDHHPSPPVLQPIKTSSFIANSQWSAPTRLMTSGSGFTFTPLTQHQALTTTINATLAYHSLAVTCIFSETRRVKWWPFSKITNYIQLRKTDKPYDALVPLRIP